jgi:hypothetical protein
VGGRIMSFAAASLSRASAGASHRDHSRCQLVSGLHLWSGLGLEGPGDSWWRVKIHVDHETVHRVVECAPASKASAQPPPADSDYAPWRGDHQWAPELEIWPSWHQLAADLGAGEPKALTELDDRCRSNGDRLRDSAKWMATVIGIALAGMVGTSPLADMRARGPWAWVLGIVGLVLVGVTLLLVLEVIRPEPAAFNDIQNAVDGPLHDWRQMIESEQDLYLPCGVRCLLTLRQAMLVDELTLNALALAINDPQPAGQDLRELLTKTLKGRMARLSELRSAAARIITIADFYQLQRRTALAAWAGTACGVAGISAIIAAFVLPAAV